MNACLAEEGAKSVCFPSGGPSCDMESGRGDPERMKGCWKYQVFL